MSDGKERLHCHIPTELKERMNSSDEPITKQVVEALEIYYGEDQTGNRAAVERQIQRYQEQKARAQQMIQDGEDMLKEAEQGISRLEQRLTQLEQKTRSYDDDLDELLSDMRERQMSVQPDNVSVQRIAREHQRSAKGVIDDLQERADLDESYFTPGKPDVEDEDDVEYDNWGQ